MKRVLIISPHFPPVNAPDMQRVRMSLPYYKSLGWEPVVLCVDEQYVSGYKDSLLSESIPDDVEVHSVKAWSEKISRRIGVGSLSLRSYFDFKRAGNKLLSERKFDLILFSTSLFHVCALGRYWHKRFGIPFIIDMQDPWRNDFFLNKPKSQRPPKFWLNHILNKKLEAYTMPYVGGIISVSQAYINNLRIRYLELNNKPSLLLPFGASILDFEIAQQNKVLSEVIQHNGKINVVYVGAINKFFVPLIKAFFLAFKNKVKNSNDYHFYFIGTNYTPSSVKPIEEIGIRLGLQDLITEIPERIPYFAALSTLMDADILFIPGSSDSDYNASKVYNNIFSGKPIFSIFNEKSLVKEAINETNAGIVVGVLETDDEPTVIKKIESAMPMFCELHHRENKLNQQSLKKYLATTMTEHQVRLFNKIAAA